MKENYSILSRGYNKLINCFIHLGEEYQNQNHQHKGPFLGRTADSIVNRLAILKPKHFSCH